MEVQFDYTPADLRVMQRAWWMGAARWQTFLTTLAVLTAIYAVMFVAIDGAFREFVPIRAVAIGGAVALVVTVLMFATGYLLAPLAARKAWREHKLLSGTFHWHWDDAGVTIAGARGSSLLPWELLHGWLDSPGTVLLYQSSRLVNALPKRVLNDAAADDLIAHLRRAHVPERRRFGLLASRTANSGPN